MTDEELVYAIVMDVTLASDKKMYEVFWIRDGGKGVTFEDKLTAMMVVEQIEREMYEVFELTKMRVVKIKKNTEFVTFPDPLQVPLLMQQKKLPDGKYECPIAEFYVKIMVTPEVKEMFKMFKVQAKKVHKEALLGKLVSH